MNGQFELHFKSNHYRQGGQQQCTHNDFYLFICYTFTSTHVSSREVEAIKNGLGLLPAFTDCFHSASDHISMSVCITEADFFIFCPISNRPAVFLGQNSIGIT